MNPNAKEFVPAHILKKRQEEADAKKVGELTEKVDGVKLAEDHQRPPENGDSTTSKKASVKAQSGEKYYEFNGEEFIVPGEDDEEYEDEVANSGYDFGNAEDNEDQDIANAFEEFLDSLPNEES